MFFKQSETYKDDLLALFAKTRTYFELKRMIDELLHQKAEKLAEAAEKKAEKAQEKIETAFKNGIEMALKRKADGDTDIVIELPDELKPKKSKKGVKQLRDHTKLGQLTS